MDNCISVFHKEQNDRVFRIYVTDTLKLLTENTAKMVGGNVMTIRFYDILNPPKEEERTEEEVVNDLMDKLRKV